MSKQPENTYRAIRPNAQAFDKIVIETVPRYKTSGLSGNEWRISARVTFFRKGEEFPQESGFRNVETAAQLLYSAYIKATESGSAFFGGVDDRCDQEGCAEEATVWYRVKEEFSRDNPYEWKRPALAYGKGVGRTVPVVRGFCDRHSRRGDCAFDDADANYETLGGSLVEPRPGDVKKSAVAYVNVESVEDVPSAIRDILDEFKPGDA